ncbi:MAG: D-alanyl-D-alanine carboxypeptidase/D-alanyl-D-alanine-endopeptidase [Prevotella sp.]|nr:D-alanyl-D-alanine carboxypeptidase/D-alanyl-D-alanine-endopeptidase [Prevotella sp.]
MKKLLLISYILCLVVGLQAQTEPQEVGNYKVAFVEPVDSTLLSPDSLLATDPMDLPWPENVITRLDKLLDEPLLRRSQVGLMVYDLTADTIIFRYGERQTMRPASVMKLVTAITALDKLGSNYQFRTSLYYTGQLIGNVLNGDLYCVGGMDPRFNNDDMSAFVDRVLGMGVDTIRGRIIGDYSMKDDTRLGEGWCWDDDNPILSPLLISKKADFLRNFVDEMRNKNIVVGDNFAEGALPNGAYVVGSRFHAIDQILTRMLKESDNLYAESMFYQVAASGGTKHASAANARTHIKKLISKIGLNPDNYKIADGSGLSLYNYVSPELMVRLLRYAYRNSEIYSSLYPALPIAGEDGTLSKRMKGKYTIGNVRAKTGTLTGISSLAGYCHSANNHLLAFCIINQGVMRNADGKAFQDKVCTALCQP